MFVCFCISLLENKHAKKFWPICKVRRSKWKKQRVHNHSQWSKEAGSPFISFSYKQVLSPLFIVPGGSSFGEHGVQNNLRILGYRNVGDQAKQLPKEIWQYLSEKWRRASRTAAGYKRWQKSRVWAEMFLENVTAVLESLKGFVLSWRTHKSFPVVHECVCFCVKGFILTLTGNNLFTHFFLCRGE